jgi:hypothetical protein
MLDFQRVGNVSTGRGVRASVRAAWQWWTRVAHRIGDVQARILLTLFYYLIVAPFAVVLRRRDPLAIRPGAVTGWRPREPGACPVAEQARRQS